MTAYEIPLSPKPQTFAIALGAITYQMTIVWNATLACWVLDIASDSGVPIVSGIPVVTGLDLLAQYGYLGFTGALVVQTDGSSALITEVDGNGSVPVVGPGSWFVVGSSEIGGGDAIWGPSLGVVAGTPNSGLAANIIPNDVPKFDNLGVAGRIYFVVES